MKREDYFLLIIILCLITLSGCLKKPKGSESNPISDSLGEDSLLSNPKSPDDPDYQEGVNRWLLEDRVPPEIRGTLSKLKNQFQFFFGLNPFYLRGDFNGDGDSDIAILIEEINSKKRGILIYHGNSEETFVIGAGTILQREIHIPRNTPSDDFDWMHIWYVYGKKEVRRGVGEEKSLQLIGEAIYAEKAEAASGLIYWNGKGYYFYQQGD